MQRAQSSSNTEICKSILFLPDFDLFLIDQRIFLAESLFYQFSKYLCASASAWLIFFSFTCRWVLLILRERTCLLQSLNVASTPTAFRNTTKAVPIYSVMLSLFSRKVNSLWDPNSLLLPIYIVLLGSELINKSCSPEKPVCSVLVIRTIFFWEN